MSIDWGKPIQTRDGREVRIYTQQGRHPTRVVVGEVCDREDVVTDRWYANGSYFGDGRLADSDLVNVPQKHTVWVNVHRSDGALFRFNVYKNKAEADGIALSNRVACFEYTFTEGEGNEGTNAERTKDD